MSSSRNIGYSQIGTTSVLPLGRLICFWLIRFQFLPFWHCIFLLFRLSGQSRSVLAQISHCNSGSEICAFDEPGFWFLSISVAGYHEPHRHSGSYTYIQCEISAMGKKGRRQPRQGRLLWSHREVPTKGPSSSSARAQRATANICFLAHLKALSWLECWIVVGEGLGGRTEGGSGRWTGLSPRSCWAVRALLVHSKEQPATRHQNSRSSISVRERRNWGIPYRSTWNYWMLENGAFFPCFFGKQCMGSPMRRWESSLYLIK